LCALSDVQGEQPAARRITTQVLAFGVDTPFMRIPSISLNSAFVRSMPTIDPTARVEKRTAPEGVGKPGAARTTGKAGVSTPSSRSRKSRRRASLDGLGQEVDVFA